MQPIRILLAEDDPLDVMDIRRSLDKANVLYQLTTARNGEEVLALLGDKGSVTALQDLLLIDINMPKMNGLELLAEIRSHEEWNRLKCFILTTSDQKTDRKTAEKLGISGYIIKPLKLNSPATMDAFNLMIDLMNFSSSE